MHVLTITPVNEDKEKSWPQVLVISIAAMISFTCGLFYTWPSPSIPILLEETNITLHEVSYITVIPSIAISLFSPYPGLLLDRIGRKKMLMLIALPQLATWALIGIGGNVWVLYGARVMNGIADAMTFTAVPCYISEVATPKVRSIWGNTMTMSINLGNLVMSAVGSYLSIQLSAIVLGIIPIVFLMGMILMPETPYYLIMKKKTDKARRSLQWLRGRKDVEEELNQLIADVERQLSERGRYKDLWIIPSNRKAVFIGILARGMQQFSGISAISMFCQYIFGKAGGGVKPTTSSIIYTFAMFVSNIIASMILDRIGRRILTVISCLGSGILLFVMAGYFYLSTETKFNLDSYQFLPIIVMLCYVFFYSIGLGITPTLMLGELFSSSVKGKALCIMNVFFGIWIISSNKTFSLLMMHYGMHVPFLVFGVCCFISAVNSYYFTPETKGKTLEEIQQAFKKQTGEIKIISNGKL